MLSADLAPLYQAVLALHLIVLPIYVSIVNVEALGAAHILAGSE